MDDTKTTTTKQKIAFCFLSYGVIEHLDIWQRFFAGASADSYGIYMHTVEPVTSVECTQALPGAILIPRIPTAWATFSLVEVQQRLFEVAFQDESVTKFVLLSGDTIPLYHFDEIYRRFCADDKGYIRYNAKQFSDKTYNVNRAAWPSAIPWVWSTTSQWITLNRTQVALLRDNFDMLRAVFGPSELPDEHLYSVFFEGLGCLDSFHTRHDCSHIYVDWKMKGRPILFLLRRSRAPVCRIQHRIKPWTYHTEDLDRARVASIYASGCLFLRKICRNAVLKMDWTSERILQA